MHAHAGSHFGDLMAKINETADYSDEIQAGMRKCLEDFKANGAW